VVSGIVLIIFGFCAFAIVRSNASAARGEEDLRQAYQLLSVGKFRESLALYDAALGEALDERQRFYALANRGYASLALDRPLEAVPDFTAALRIEKDSIFCLVDRGLAWHRLGKFAEALADYDRAIALDSNEVDALQNRALIHAHRGQWPQAIVDMNAAIRIQPANPRWRIRLGRFYLLKGELEAALAQFNSATEISPENPEAYWLRAEVYTLQNHPERGLAEVEGALHARPNSAALHLARGMILIDALRPDLASQDLDFVLHLQPDDATALATRGLAHFALGNYQAASRDAIEAVRVAPRVPLGYYVLGLTLDAEWREKEAIENFDRAIACDSEFPPAIAWRGLAEAHAGDYERARRDLKGAVNNFPASDVTHRVRAIFLASCPAAAFRDGPTALAEAQLAVDLSHRNPAALDTLSMAYAEVGDFGLAIATEAAALEKTTVASHTRGLLQRRLHQYEQHQPYRDSR
jgi:tetratricopeptide (TPR) repeat protein